MPRSRRRYTWAVSFADPLMPVAIADRVRAVADLWCALDRHTSTFRDPLVEGENLGLIKISVTVCARDYFACHRRAIEFARAIAAAGRITLAALIDPEPMRLPPHSHRGRRRWEAPKWQEANDGSDQPAGEPC